MQKIIAEVRESWTDYEEANARFAREFTSREQAEAERDEVVALLKAACASTDNQASWSKPPWYYRARDFLDKMEKTA